jgi:zinc/manganese transport system substrate-binding protein
MHVLKRLLVGGALLASALPATAALQVAATTPNMAMLARTVGGEHVEVVVLAPGDRDVHHFEAAAAVTLEDAGTPADRALGDVHPMGNPHIYFDPLRMGVAAEALAAQLAVLDPAHAPVFTANAAAFAARMREETAAWRERAAGAPGVLLHHKDAVYLMRRLDVEVLGYLEPLPGIPPTARHIAELVTELQGREGMIFRMEYEPAEGAQRIGAALGWPVHQMRNNVPVDGTADDYVALIESWVLRLEGN